MKYELLRTKLMEHFILMEENIKNFYLHVLVEDIATKTQNDLNVSPDELLQNKKIQEVYTNTLRNIISDLPVHIINTANIIRELQVYSDIIEIFLRNNPKNKHKLTPNKLFDVVNGLKRIRNKITHNLEGEISDRVLDKLTLGDKKFDPKWTEKEKIRYIELALIHVSSLFDLYSSESYLYLSESISVDNEDGLDNDKVQIKAHDAKKKKRINIIPFKSWVKKK